MKLTEKQALELAISDSDKNQNNAVYAVSFNHVEQAEVDLDELRKDTNIVAGVTVINYKPHVMLHKHIINKIAGKAINTLLQKATEHDATHTKIDFADVEKAGLNPKKLLDNGIAQGHTADNKNEYLIFDKKSLEKMRNTDEPVNERTMGRW